MTVAMLVVVTVQVNWLESSAKLRKEVFDQSVEQSLQIVATWLTAGHLDEVRSDDRNLLRTDELAPEERMVVRRMESFPMDSLLTIALKEQGHRRGAGVWRLQPLRTAGVLAGRRRRLARRAVVPAHRVQRHLGHAPIQGAFPPAPPLLDGPNARRLRPQRRHDAAHRRHLRPHVVRHSTDQTLGPAAARLGQQPHPRTQDPDQQHRVGKRSAGRPVVRRRRQEALPEPHPRGEQASGASSWKTCCAPACPNRGPCGCTCNR